MATNTRKSIAKPSFLGRISDWYQHAWLAIKPRPLTWNGAALGLSVMTISYSVGSCMWTTITAVIRWIASELLPLRPRRFLTAPAQL